MLETEIKALREEVALLREAFATFGANLQPAAKAPTPKKEKPTAVVEAPAAAPEPVKGKVVEAVKTQEAEQPKVSRDDLQSLCMGIVRSDRTKRDAIQAAIAKFGATNLVGVKDADLARLHAELEALK